jgi:transcriptional regulator with XRE-family HTH domain
MKTGERIKKLRKECGWNQTELAEKVGMTFGGIASIEQGKSDGSISALIKLSEVFNVSLDYLITGKETERTISESEQKVIEILREDSALRDALNEAIEVKKKVINYLRNYKPQQEQRAVMG